MAVPELGDAQRGREAECGCWQRPHMPIIKSELLELMYGGGSELVIKLGSVPAIRMELSHSKASGWAKVTAEDLGECIQTFAIAMAELVGVDEVERAGVP